MSELVSPAASCGCGTITGNITISDAVAFDPLLERTRATWIAGDFGRIAVGFARGAADFIDRLSLRKGERLLDVACGTGNLAIPAARVGAQVTGIDIAANLIESARRACSEASLDIAFQVGVAEALPYEDQSFDTVVSMFGVMFSPRPYRALAELVRVTRPGGRIVLANWTPDGFVGKMLRAHSALLPAVPGTPNVLAWGDPAVIRANAREHARIGSARSATRTIDLAYPMSPGAVVELFREFYGPSVRTFASLDASGRAALSAHLLRLWIEANTAGADKTSVPAAYLETHIDVA